MSLLMTLVIFVLMTCGKNVNNNIGHICGGDVGDNVDNNLITVLGNTCLMVVVMILKKRC